MPVPEAYFDCDIDSPVEIEGSPQITTDEVTGARLLKRRYAQRQTLWKKLAYASPDPFLSNAFLVNEMNDGGQGPVLFFSRNYAEIPAPRVESDEVAFTYPGHSAAQISAVTGRYIGWNPYGQAAPASRPTVVVVEYTYGLVPTPLTLPSTALGLVAESALTFRGAAVDFSGPVFANAGTVSTPQPGDNPPIVEPDFQFQGFVGGFASGADWIISVRYSRYRGPIWQRAVTKVPHLILP